MGMYAASSPGHFDGRRLGVISHRHRGRRKAWVARAVDRPPGRPEDRVGGVFREAEGDVPGAPPILGGEDSFYRRK